MSRVEALLGSPHPYPHAHLGAHDPALGRVRWDRREGSPERARVAPRHAMEASVALRVAGPFADRSAAGTRSGRNQGRVCRRARPRTPAAASDGRIPRWSLGECRTKSKSGLRLRVTLLDASDVEALTDLVLENFRDGPDRRPRASVAQFLRGRATEDPPLGVCLVARPDSASSEICATVDIAFTPEEREPFGNGVDPPPVGSPYISNMAVGRRWRRQGVALALLAAAEAFSADTLVRGLAPGPPDSENPNLWLHVYHNDAIASELYRQAGFVERVREPWYVPALSFAGRGRRVLMAKPIRMNFKT